MPTTGKAEIISIGTELTSGRNLDTNAQWLSRRLAEMGVVVGWHSTIADDLPSNVEAFRIACRRAKLVLITGGLGPTQDDLSREALAQLSGVELVHDAESEARIRAMFRQFGRPMADRNRVQAYLPEGAEPVLNDCGTAPGIWMPVRRCWIGAMPGVPREMREMFEKQIAPRIVALKLGHGVQIERKINCFGAGESQIEEHVADLTRRGNVPEVGITASNATISLRILAHAAKRDEALRQIEPIEKTIRERLGNWVFGTDDEELQHVVLLDLQERRATLSVAEGVTGGRVAQFLTGVPGASRSFLGGVVAYDNRAKTRLLGVPQSLIEQHGAVSGEVAQSMAIGCRTQFGSDFAVSTVGIAGPQERVSSKETGLVHVALASADGVTARSHTWMGDRNEIQSRTAKMALNLVRLQFCQTGVS